jgi:hypothetical protein
MVGQQISEVVTDRLERWAALLGGERQLFK